MVLQLPQRSFTIAPYPWDNCNTWIPIFKSSKWQSYILLIFQTWCNLKQRYESFNLSSFWYSCNYLKRVTLDFPKKLLQLPPVSPTHRKDMVKMTITCYKLINEVSLNGSIALTSSCFKTWITNTMLVSVNRLKNFNNFIMHLIASTGVFFVIFPLNRIYHRRSIAQMWTFLSQNPFPVVDDRRVYCSKCTLYIENQNNLIQCDDEKWNSTTLVSSLPSCMQLNVGTYRKGWS